MNLNLNNTKERNIFPRRIGVLGTNVDFIHLSGMIYMKFDNIEVTLNVKTGIVIDYNDIIFRIVYRFSHRRPAAI